MSRDAVKKTTLVFYRGASGKESVRDWLKGLDRADRLAVGQDLIEDAGRRVGHGTQAPDGVEAMSKKHHGSSHDNFLKDEGVFEETQTLAVKEVVVWQLIEAMQQRSLTKTQLATLLKTSRSQVDRLLDPTRDVTLSTLQRAAALVGRKVQIELV